MNHRMIAEEAVRLARPAIDNLLCSKAKRKDMHIVVMHPVMKPWECSFEEAVLYEVSLSDRNEWENPYDDFARAKALQAWRDGCSNMHKHLLAPATLKEGDIAFYGSFEYEGVIVAASGVEPWFDVLVSGWVALGIQQLSQDYYLKYKTENQASAWIGRS